MSKKYFIIIIILIILAVISGIYFYYISIVGNKYTEKNKLELTNITEITKCNNPIVPEGFKKVETETATWKLDENNNIKGWNNGLVIEDEKGNQFVWIPYDKTYQIELDEIELCTNDIVRFIEQIKQYNGFYIGRYEAGVPIELQNTFNGLYTDNLDIVSTPVSKKGIIPWNYITKENAILSAEKMYNDEYISSSLISLEQRDIIDRWISNCGYDLENLKLYGNFSNSNFKFSGYYSENLGKDYIYAKKGIKTDKNIILSTGAVDTNITNNIYDLFGNVSESTANISSSKPFVCYSCGGYYDNSDKFQDFTHAWANSKAGFRVVLYIK